jgi:hypothetical protein
MYKLPCRRHHPRIGAVRSLSRSPIRRRPTAASASSLRNPPSVQIIGIRPHHATACGSSPAMPDITLYQNKGLSTRVRICVRIAIRFRARFVRKQNRDPTFFLSPIKIVCLQISAKKNKKLTCWAPLAANRTPNRTEIRMGNRTCRQPLTWYFRLYICIHGVRGRLHVRFAVRFRVRFSCTRWSAI